MTDRPERYSEAEEQEIIQVTKDLLRFLSSHNVPPSIASAALLQALLELHRAVKPHESIDDAARSLMEYIKRTFAQAAN